MTQSSQSGAYQIDRTLKEQHEDSRKENKKMIRLLWLSVIISFLALLAVTVSMFIK